MYIIVEKNGAIHGFKSPLKFAAEIPWKRDKIRRLEWKK